MLLKTDVEAICSVGTHKEVCWFFFFSFPAFFSNIYSNVRADSHFRNISRVSHTLPEQLHSLCSGVMSYACSSPLAALEGVTFTQSFKLFHGAEARMAFATCKTCHISATLPFLRLWKILALIFIIAEVIAIKSLFEWRLMYHGFQSDWITLNSIPSILEKPQCPLGL